MRARSNRTAAAFAANTVATRLVSLATLAALTAALVATAALAAGNSFTGTCKAKPDVPCSVSAGQTYGGYTVDDADDTEENVEGVLKGVLGTNKVDLEPLFTDIRESTGDMTLLPSPLELNAHRAFSWNYEGDASELAYVTMVSQGDDETGFAIAPIFADGQGSVDFTEILPEADDSGFGLTVSFWTSVYSPPCQEIKLEESAHGKLVENCRLTPIKKGKVPCVESDTLAVTRCRYKDGRSGDVLHAARGNAKYARATGTLTKKGKRGGGFILGMKLSSEGEPTCADPAGGGMRKRDTTGTSSSTPLAGGCMVEQLLTATNRSGQPLRNYASLPVCTSSFPHPDGLTPMSNPSPGVYCYMEEGAGLNDPTGRERRAPTDADKRARGTQPGVYYTSVRDCHMAMITPSVSIWVAKRPANSGRTVLTNTPLLWRPIVPVPIANP